eukprot:gb/GECG01001315.1/.p1 GENE.gb/GECG01001315.1/~~gb/GECG01001315.1/.p1  ORF type:complete len:417 (+),score=35.39 gb/GECG01001315.1/:1-1251(+)
MKRKAVAEPGAYDGKESSPGGQKHVAITKATRRSFPSPKLEESNGHSCLAPLSSKVINEEESVHFKPQTTKDAPASDVLSAETGTRRTRAAKAANTHTSSRLRNGRSVGAVITSVIKNGHTGNSGAFALLHPPEAAGESRTSRTSSDDSSLHSANGESHSFQRTRSKATDACTSSDQSCSKISHNERERERSRRISEHIQELREILERIGIQQRVSNKQNTLETVKAILRENIHKLAAPPASIGDQTASTELPVAHTPHWDQILENAGVLGCVADSQGNIYAMTKALNALLQACFRVDTERLTHSLFSIVCVQCHGSLHTMLQGSALPGHPSGAACMALRMRPELGHYGLSDVWICVHRASVNGVEKEGGHKLVWVIPINHYDQYYVHGNTRSANIHSPATLMNPTFLARHHTLQR